MTDTLDQPSFIGVWQRESLSVEKGEAFEDSNVLWLHAGDYFADLRWPKPGFTHVKSSAFAGRAYWNAPSMKFIHEIDLTKELEEDTGILSFSNGKLIEAGQVTIEDKMIRFEETWIRLSRADQGGCQIARKSQALDSAYIIRIADFVIAMEETEQGFSAAGWRYENENWNLLFGLGDIQRLSEFRSALSADTLPQEWQVKI
ncbi:MAG: hypothetical protein JKY88_04110 [Pseudomonadales bacterium]|nr:hypothetical protein [Pseudomonadales bacterium]